MSHQQWSSLKRFPLDAVIRLIAAAGVVGLLISSALQSTAVSRTLVPETHGSTQEINIEPSTLELGKPFDRELSGGQKHVYQIELTEGQFFSIELKLLHIDVIMSLQSPDAKPIIIFESIGVAQQTNYGAAIYRVALSSGIHRLTVYARTKATAGRYEIRLAELRPATEDDRALQEARELIEESLRLNREGKSAEARSFLIRAIEIRERVSGPNSYGLAAPLNMLAGNFEEAGDYASAEPLRLRGVKIAELARGPEHAEVARYLVSLGGHYQKRGDDIKAEEVFQRTLRIFERTHTAENHGVAALLTALGGIYYAKGDYGNAEKNYQRARAIFEKLLGPDDFHIESTYISLGRVAYDAGDYANAETMFARALSLREKALGPEGLGIPQRLNDLAMLYITTGDYAKAEAFYQRALSIPERAGMNDPSVLETLFGLSRLYAAQGRPSEALKFQKRASEIEEHLIELNLAAGSEREKLAFLSNLATRSSRNISLHASIESKNPVARDLALTTILRYKGRALDAMANSLAALRGRSGKAEQGLFDKMNEVTSQLTQLVLNGPMNTSVAEHQNKVKALEKQRETLEADISRLSAGFYSKAEPVTVSAVQAAIPEEAALIEFAVYQPFDPKAPDNQKAYGDPHYIAYVLRHTGEVQWAELGDAKKIEDAIGALRRAVRSPTRTDVRNLARAVDEKVMRPARALLGDSKRLLISPDGDLNLIPFEALVDEHGRYLVEQHAFVYLTSGRDLLRLKTQRESKSSPVVFADPIFGDPPLVSSAQGSGGNGLNRARFNYSQIFFGPLPGVGDEVRALKTLLPQATFLTKEQATEAALKRVHAPSILHIATHGFFLDNDSSAENREAAKPSGKTRLGKWVSRLDNPQLRSGLALAGANQGRSGEEDGVLTALEATALDLWGTKLVVLSACDTGVGDVKNGDGVYGLRRALFLAGTESQLMSLWPVSDRSTRDLMTGYYQALVQNVGRGEALRQVQLQMLHNRRRSHPYYWASFILAGEWADLKGNR